MGKIVEISDLSAPELDLFARLTEPQLRSKVDVEKGILIAESPKVIGTALDAGYEPLCFLTEKEKLATQAAPLLARCPDTVFYAGDRRLLEGLTGFTLSRGVLCAMRRKPPRTMESVCGPARRLAVLEGIVDSTNVGAIFRSAAALGMDGVLLSPNCCDPLCRRSIRVSMGTVFQIPWAYFDGDLDRWKREGPAVLRDLGFVTAAMALDSRSIGIDDPALEKAEKLAILLGTEGTGLEKATISACDHTVMIPMAHGVDSLNVGAAAAVAFWALRPKKVLENP